MTDFKQLLSSSLVYRRAALIAWPGHLWSLAGFAGLIAGGIESGGQSGVAWGGCSIPVVTCPPAILVFLRLKCGGGDDN